MFEVRSLTRDDLKTLEAERVKSGVVARLRNTHHMVARLDAAGLRTERIAQETGYSNVRIYTLRADPAYQELVARYRAEVDAAYKSAEEERYVLAREVEMKALRTIADHFEAADEENELVPLNRAVAVFSELSDRVGIPRKSVNTNLNVDFAKQLEEAIARSSQAQDSSPTLVPSPPSVEPPVSANSHDRDNSGAQMPRLFATRR